MSMTNRDLREQVAHGRFRCDLHYRLDVIRIERYDLDQTPRGGLA
jgi:transcriptional regulator with GAF, ATPase, and Fis domain